MLPEKPWVLEAVVLLFLGVMTSVFFGGGVAWMVGQVTLDWPKAQSDFWQLVVAASFVEIPALAGIVLFLRFHHVGWKEAFGLQSEAPVTAVAYGVLAGTLFVPAAWVLQALSAYLMGLVHVQAQDQQIVQELQQPSLNSLEKVFIGLLAIVIAPVVEELLFRGLLYPALKRLGRPRLALWVSSTLFAAVHFNMQSFVPLLIFGLLLVYLYETFQNLLASMVAHSLFNASNFVVLVFQEQIERVLHVHLT